MSSFMDIRCTRLCRIVILIQKFRISEQNLSLQSPGSSVTSFGFEQCWECCRKETTKLKDCPQFLQTLKSLLEIVSSSVLLILGSCVFLFNLPRFLSVSTRWGCSAASSDSWTLPSLKLSGFSSSIWLWMETNSIKMKQNCKFLNYKIIQMCELFLLNRNLNVDHQL